MINKANNNLYQDKKETSGVVLTVSNPAEWVDRWSGGLEYLEPTVIGTIIAPSVYLSGILELCHAKVGHRILLNINNHCCNMLQRGEQRSVTNIDQNRLNIQFLLPLNEIVTSFYDDLKSISSGYASFDYEDAGYQKSELLKLGEIVVHLLLDQILVMTRIIFQTCC